MRPIFIGVFPNFTKTEYIETFKLIFSRVGESTRRLFEGKLKDYLQKNNQGELLHSEIFLTDSARSSFYLILKSLDLPPGSEVILPSFTCVVIVNPVKWTGFTPVYADISEETFNTSVEELISKVTEKTKVILIQHTFGAQIDVARLKRELVSIGRQDIFLVEDVAHALGTSNVGISSDFSVLTFGVEKMITTIRGGALIVNRTENTMPLIESIRQTYTALPELGALRQLRLIVNPLFWWFVSPIYYAGIGKFTLGKLFIGVARLLGLLGIAIDKIEYKGGMPKYLPAKMPIRFCKLGLIQIEKLNTMNEHRRRLSRKYHHIIEETQFRDNPEQKYIGRTLENDQPHGFIRYPLVLKNKRQRDRLYRSASNNKIVLGDWYKTMFYTSEEYLTALGYIKGSCQHSENIAERIINLPTAINTTSSHVDLIGQILKEIEDL